MLLLAARDRVELARCRFGEQQLTLTCLALVLVGCLLIPLAPVDRSQPVVYVAVALLAFGTGLVTPSLRSLVSRRLSSGGQGAALGSLQGLQSLGTFLGASAAGFSYDRIGVTSPFWFGSMMLIGVALLVAGSIRNRPETIQD